jgi:hypothetical protein
VDKIYETGGRRYVQRPILLGQIRLLLPLVSGIAVHPDMSELDLISQLGDRLPAALAIILVEESAADLRAAMQSEALSARTEDLAWSVGPETALEVITDFFELTPISSIGAKIAAALKQLSARLPKTNSNPPSSNSAAETSPNETSSSGQSGPGEPISGLN